MPTPIARHRHSRDTVPSHDIQKRLPGSWGWCASIGPAGDFSRIDFDSRQRRPPLGTFLENTQGERESEILDTAVETRAVVLCAADLSSNHVVGRTGLGTRRISPGALGDSKRSDLETGSRKGSITAIGTGRWRGSLVHPHETESDPNPKEAATSIAFSHYWDNDSSRMSLDVAGANPRSTLGESAGSACTAHRHGSGAGIVKDTCPDFAHACTPCRS